MKQVVFFPVTEYAKNHWALQPFSLKDPHVIAMCTFQTNEKTLNYAVYANPTDRRGYRSIVRYIDPNNMRSTLNRAYSAEENCGIGVLSQLVAASYNLLVPATQIFFAGNNSHLLTSEKVAQIGKPDEPNFLHAHIIGRGDPNAEYIDGIKLGGPAFGTNFDMMGKTSNEPGNDKKIKWSDNELSKVVAYLKTAIDEAKEPYENFGLKVMTKE